MKRPTQSLSDLFQSERKNPKAWLLPYWYRTKLMAKFELFPIRGTYDCKKGGKKVDVVRDTDVYTLRHNGYEIKARVRYVHTTGI